MKTLKFNFIDEEEAMEFLSQLIDGWGEPYVNIEWEGDWDTAKSYDVQLYEEDTQSGEE